MAKRKRVIWTNDEIASLKLDYGTLSPKEMELKYSRKFSNIKQKCRMLGIKSNRKKKWTKELEENFKIDWLNRDIPTDSLEEMYDTTYSGLQSKAKELGVNRRAYLTDEDVVFAATLYDNGMSMHEISKQFKCSRSLVNSSFIRNSIPIRSPSECNRTYSITENYFREITTQEQAYYLGFLYADGHNNTKNNTISLGLHSRDVELLESFREVMGDLNRPIVSYKTADSDEIYVRFTVTNKRLSIDLNKIGMVENKTFKIVYPKCLPESIDSHFIRGYFDGDGHIGIYEDNKISTTIIGTMELLTSIKRKIAKSVPSLNKDAIKITPAKPGMEIMELRVSGGIQVEKVLDYIYKDSIVHLSRKYKQYKSVKNRQKDRWASRRSSGKRGINKKTVAERVLEYLMALDEHVESVEKKELFGLFVKKEKLSNANISYHTKVLNSLIAERKLQGVYVTGYKFVRIFKAHE